MKYFVKLTSVLAGFILIVNTCAGQQVVATSGGQASDANFDLSWTIGEPLTTTFSNESLVITQGFHQSQLIISSIKRNADLANSFIIYPNPVQNEITIDFGTFNKACRIILRNNAGEVIANENYLGTFQKNKLNFDYYEQGVYILQIMNNAGTLLQSNKIIKL